MRPAPSRDRTETPQVLKEDKTKRYRMAPTTIEMAVAELEVT